MKKSTENAAHYHWGEGCSGWHLVKTEELSVIQELMPPETQETTHHHQKAQQLFFILKGKATFEVEGKIVEAAENEGVHVPPGTLHKIRNETSGELHFLVISQPSAKGDRVEAVKQENPANINGQQETAGINFHNRYFKSVSNSANGEVGEETLFHYRQKGNVIWATYEGGSVQFGTLSGIINISGQPEFTYQHMNREGEFMTGKCISVPEVLPDGRIRLSEEWQWTCKDHSKGESVVEEVQERS